MSLILKKPLHSEHLLVMSSVMMSVPCLVVVAVLPSTGALDDRLKADLTAHREVPPTQHSSNRKLLGTVVG